MGMWHKLFFGQDIKTESEQVIEQLTRIANNLDNLVKLKRGGA